MSDEWGLEKAIAWVLWRDVTVLDKMQSDSLAAMLMYKPYSEGYEDSLNRVGKFNDLLAALRTGHLIARGRVNRSGDRIAMTPEQWRDLTLDVSVYNGTRAIPEDGIGKGTIWEDLRFSVAEVHGYFPPADGRRKSKTKSEGDGAIDDDALLREMNTLIHKEVCSRLAAARRIAQEAKGGGTIESKVRRLTRKYRTRYPNEK
jgi:hypothetical protein